MRDCHFLILCAIFLFSLTSHATTFSKLKGTYAVTSCQNLSAHPSEDLCQYDTMVIHPHELVTAIYFQHTAVDGVVSIRSFGYPPKTSNKSEYYEEEGDYFATYSRDSYGYKESTYIERSTDNYFHFTRSQSSEAFKTSDRFEITLQKISDEAPELPSVPGDDIPD